ncbi:DEAD/DEAH box helicase, partial [bacterium]|nr:DEAD/DEAH box helicase [bacterium]
MRFGHAIFHFAVFEESEGVSLREAVEIHDSIRDEGRSGVLDEVESQIFDVLSWFRLNDARDDFVDIPKAWMGAFNNAARNADPNQRAVLLAFFKKCIFKVSKAPFNLRKILRDSKKKYIRPITDGNESYARLFADIIVFCLNIVSLNMHDLFSTPEEFENVRRIVGNFRERSSLQPIEFDELKELWKLLVGQRLTPNKPDLLIWFIKFRCRDPGNGHLATASDIETLSAKCFYFCRLYWLMSLTSTPPSRMAVFRRKKKAVKDYFRDVDTPFYRLCDLKALANRLATFEDVNIRVITDPRTPDLIHIGGHPFDRRRLGEAFRGMCHRFEELLSLLSLGYPFDFETCAFQDRITSWEITFEEMNHPHGSGSQVPSRNHEKLMGLLRHVMSSQRFVASRNAETGECEININPALDYVGWYEEACEVLCALVHIGSGMPARATELCGLKFFDRVSKRNVFWSGEQLMTVTRLNKRNKLSGINHVICRFLPKLISKKVAAFILIVNPAYAFLARHIYGSSLSGELTSRLFLKNGRHFTPSHTREVVSMCLLKFGGLSVRFNDYRHAANHFARNVMKFESTDSRTIIAGQMGHSESTARSRYSRNENEPLVPAYVADEFKQLSTRWISFITGEDSSSSGHPQLSPSSSPSNSVPVQVEVPSGSSQQIDPYSYYPAQEDVKRICNLMAQKLGHSSFKSAAQRMATLTCIKTNFDVISVIPTGGGKSLIYFLHAIESRHNDLISLVVVPTVGLRQQLLNLAATVFKVSATDSVARVPSGTKMIFCTPETVKNQISDIMTLIGSKRMSRIFLDEAHTIVIDDHWRFDLNSLNFLKRLKVPLTFLTGTLSLSREKELKDRFNRDEFQILSFRESTNRPNLKYHIIRNGDMRKVDQVLGAVTVEKRGIVFVRAKNEIGSIFESSQFSELMTGYHSELTDDDKQSSSDLWKTGQKRIMISTSGFGVGIDCGSVNTVVCFGVPYSFE